MIAEVKLHKVIKNDLHQQERNKANVDAQNPIPIGRILVPMLHHWQHNGEKRPTEANNDCRRKTNQEWTQNQDKFFNGQGRQVHEAVQKILGFDEKSKAGTAANRIVGRGGLGRRGTTWHHDDEILWLRRRCV